MFKNVSPFVCPCDKTVLIKWYPKCPLSILTTHTNNSRSSTDDNYDIISKNLWWQQSTLDLLFLLNVSMFRKTLTCRIQVVGIGVVAKYRVKVNIKALSVL